MNGKSVHARAQLKSLEVTETYFYESTISRNPSTQPGRTPIGRIEGILPYDGRDYFTRQAQRDVEHQVSDAPGGDVDASIGHLALRSHGRTDLKDVVDLGEHYGSIPLHVPVHGRRIASESHLTDDRYACRIAFDYVPQWPDTIPVNVDIQLWDEDTLSVPDFSGEKVQSRPGDAAAHLAQQVSFRRSLLITSRVTADIYRGSVPAGRHPRVKRMALGWPTITSCRALQLGIGHVPPILPPDKEVPVMFDPLTRRLEWMDVPMKADEQVPGTDVRAYVTEEMHLLMDYPGELYQESVLEGEVEIEIPGRLLSGLSVRLFNALGERVQSLEPRLESRVVVRFRLVLDEAFSRRKLSPYQHLYFDELIPDEMRIDDVRAALKDRGFRFRGDYPVPSRNEITHFFLTERAEGPDLMRLVVFVDGRRHEAERETQVQGGQTYRSTSESGELKVYIRGEMPGNSRRLIQEMNALQTALHERFEHLRARR
jgi:hypothetical protein